ncbi:MAG: FecR family protein [Thermoflavifilum sp.]|nr:FecR family protein [Thermoflavifilum sp.]
MEDRIWILIGKKLSASLSQAEEQELNDLLKQYPAAQYTLEVLQSCWQLPKPDSSAKATEENIDLLMNQPLSHKKLRTFDWLGLIIIGLLFGVGIWIYQGVILPLSRPVLATKEKSGHNQIITRYGSRTHVVLPDSSEVWLNAGSTLSYAENFAQASVREVFLQGEAYFDVHHDENHPFIIHTPDLDIRDLGTVFNVKAYPDDPTIEATLISGSIEVILKNTDRRIQLKPHEKLVWFRGNDSLSLHLPDQPNIVLQNNHYLVQEIHQDKKYKMYPETAWLNNRIIFENEAFSQLAKEMERRYAVRIHICCDDIAETPLTGSFADETLQQALDELKLITHFQYQIKDHEVFITH